MMASAGIGPDPAAIRPLWVSLVSEVLERATLARPTADFALTGGRSGRHTEHLGHLLAEMQIVARSHPGAEW